MRVVFFVVAFFVACAYASAYAIERRDHAKHIKAHIYLIRHGEKRDDDTKGLSSDGKSRAKCIAKKFSQPTMRPDYIIAQQYMENGRRIRPYLTVKPLANKLHMDVDHSCDRDEPECAVDAIQKAVKNGAKRILVCWEHRLLTDIAKKLGIKDLHYPSDRFDIVFHLYNGEMLDIFSEQCPRLDRKYRGWDGRKDSNLIDDGSWAKGAGIAV